MADYIDRAALTEQLRTIMTRYFAQGRVDVAKDYNWAITVLDSAPAADVAEVVRCEGCKHSYTKNRPCDTALFRWCRKWDNIVRDCDFCSYGERRGDNVSD